jgi:hypothetical protein
VTVRRLNASRSAQRRLPSPTGKRGGSDIGANASQSRTGILRLLCAGLLGAGAAVLVSCGSSGAGLIPSENAGPLVAAFQAVEQAASKGDGNCAPTRAALSTTEHDFQALPASVNAGLRARLREGISHLQTLALELCAEPLALTTTTGESTSTTTTTTPPATTKTTSTTPSTSTTPPTSTTTGTSTAPTDTTPGSGTEGGTPPEVGAGEGKAGESGGSEAEEHANNGGAGAGPSGGAGVGGSGQ